MSKEKSKRAGGWAGKHGGIIIGAGAWVLIGLLTLTMAFCGPG